MLRRRLRISANESENLIAETATFTLVDAVNLDPCMARDFNNGGQRPSEKTAPTRNSKVWNTCKSQRRAKLNRSAAAFLRRDVNGSLEAVEDGSNDIHADAAPETS